MAIFIMTAVKLEDKDDDISFQTDVENIRKMMDIDNYMKEYKHYTLQLEVLKEFRPEIVEGIFSIKIAREFFHFEMFGEEVVSIFVTLEIILLDKNILDIENELHMEIEALKTNFCEQYKILTNLEFLENKFKTQLNCLFNKACSKLDTHINLLTIRKRNFLKRYRTLCEFFEEMRKKEIELFESTKMLDELLKTRKDKHLKLLEIVNESCSNDMEKLNLHIEKRREDSKNYWKKISKKCFSELDIILKPAYEGEIDLKKEKSCFFIENFRKIVLKFRNVAKYHHLKKMKEKDRTDCVVFLKFLKEKVNELNESFIKVDEVYCTYRDMLFEI